MRALALVAAFSIGCSAMTGTVERWPAVVVEKWPELRPTADGSQEVSRFAEFNVASHGNITLQVDLETYSRLTAGMELTLEVRVDRQGLAIPGADTVIDWGPPAKAREGQDA